MSQHDLPQRGQEPAHRSSPVPPVPEPGAALPTAVSETLGARLGFDVSQVRIHADGPAAAENRRLGSVAHTVGRDIWFARDAYAPHTGPGQSLLAHELTHVAQQLSGSTSSEEVQEREARAAEHGGRLAPRSLRPNAPPVMAVRLRRGDVLSITVTPRSDGTVGFVAALDGGGTASASGTARDLAAGSYWARLGSLHVILTRDEGPPLASIDYFNIPWSSNNAGFLNAISRTGGRVRLVVTATAEPGTGGTPGPGRADPSAELRRQLDALPDRIKAILFQSGPSSTPARPEDYPTLLRVAAKLDELSDAELAEYADRTTTSTRDTTRFEASIDAWIALLRARRSVERETDEATTALIGMDGVYEMYRSWRTGLLMGDPPGFVMAWEGVPTAQLPASHPGALSDLYLRMRRSMDPFGYPTLRSFEEALSRFRIAFRESAFTTAIELLDRYEHVLLREQARYGAGGAATTSLHTDLAGARSTFTAAEDYRSDALRANSGLDPDAVTGSYAAGIEYQRQLDVGRGEVKAQADLHPLIGYANFPVDELARSSDAASTGAVMTGYITSSLARISDTRTRLSGNHELIFKLNTLVDRTKVRTGVAAGSIWDKIITDHQAPTLDEMERELMLAVLAVALGIASGGSAVAAVSALALSSYMALQTYEDYAMRSDAYGAQLLSDEPSLGWVVLAIVAVVADLGVVATIIRPIRPALTAFQETGDLAALEARLAGVDARIKASILSRAELELRSRGGWDAIWENVVPRGAVRGSALGVDLVAEQVGKLVYSIQLNLRRGINTFTRWRLTREAAQLVGDVNALSPAQIRRLRTAYAQAVENAQRLVTEGRSLGMSVDEVESVMQAWARRGSGTIEEVIAEMRAARPAGAATTGSPWTPPRSWNGPVNHGSWSGVRGNSGWIDQRPEVIRVVGRSSSGAANPIPFREGVVDFSRWSRGELSVPGLVGDHAADMNRIRLAIAEREGLLPGASRSRRIQAALDWLRNADDGFGGRGLRPHHAGGSRIQLVPRDVHKVQHTDLANYDAL